MTSSLPIRRLKPGFAIIVTVSILVLLAVIAVGLLTLSTVTVRAASQGSALSEARANAKLAMVLAIGDLQKHIGPDQRITASADILDEDAAHPHWTGVWDSWKAGSQSSGGDQTSDHATIPGAKNSGMSPSYTEGREDHFRSWLVSLSKEQMERIDSAESLTLSGDLTPDTQSTAVKLLGAGTLASAPDTSHVSAGLTDINAKVGKGRYGWWVGDESQKARLANDSRSTTWDSSLGDQVFHHQAPGNTGFQALAPFSGLADSEEMDQVISRASIDLLDGVAADNAKAEFHSLTPFSYGLLSDVREGGLKRDLSAILERPVNLRDSGDDYMLYRFGRGRDRVPIQDLSAYYQLYNKQVVFNSRQLRGGLQVNNPDFAGNTSAFTREYTNLYRLPVPIKVQFLLSLIAEPRTSAEKRNNPRNTDAYKLNIGISPAITLWNPNSLPMVMNLGAKNATQFRFFNMPLAIRWTKEGSGYTTTKPTSLAWIANGASRGDRDTGFTVFFSGQKSVVFEPGQVRVFSLANTGLRELRNSDVFKADREVTPGWNPETFLRMKRSDRSNNARHIEPPNGDALGALTFNAGDKISFTIEPTEVTDLANGSALQFFNRQSAVGGEKRWMDRHFQLVSRLKGADGNFNQRLMAQSFPDGAQRLEFEAKTGREIVNGPLPFLLVNLVAGCETHESASLSPFGGRHFASRPFLHSSPITGTVFIDNESADGAYQHGWNWWVEDINSVFEANVSIDPDNNGYYGGGYTVEHGTTHVVQQEIPVVPPISIASLSHAHLGGFSLANANLGAGASNTSTAFQETTASGQGGLFPHTVQAIGNSYAHPQLAADQAHATWSRKYTEKSSAKSVPFVDHSYLANKALWDEFFFSSIVPRNTDIYGTDRKTAQETAQEFFFGDTPLPNHRFTPHLSNLTESTLDGYFSRGATSLTGADEIASHLMVEGPFNINSTSSHAWQAVFSSLKGKNVSFLDLDSSLSGKLEFDSRETKGTAVGSTSLPNGEPYSESPTAPSEPDQWTDWRELTDAEVEELSEAMVKQVRLRGPFLSLSEFINRRLDSSKTDLAIKGALQAALDDEDVSINSGFRDDDRSLTPEQTSGMRPRFREALEGPVAYGSAAYVDQADILRNLAGQLTPRGDTFVIRTYGDSVDGSGNVKARAWCEAIVQRVPDYLHPDDEPHLKFDDLTKDANKTFGRRLHVVSFRFLSPSEV